MTEKARAIHGQAEIARESGDFLKALQLTDEGTIAYQKEGDLLGLAEIQSSRFITLKHLFQKTGEKSYLVLAKHAAESSVEIAQHSGQPEALAIPYLNLGEAYAQLEQWSEAVEAYSKAVAYFTKSPPPFNNRPAVLSNIKSHLYQAEYKTGDKSALARAEQVIKELEKQDEDSYNKNVWLSGAHMRIAEKVKDDNLLKAQEHLQIAKEIIDSDKRLELRKGQWKKLNSQFTS
ncbi:MAG: tetratricopeptide repeat protein [bacterium]|nr:tetratricopeptide repeat protein [bacterium]